MTSDQVSNQLTVLHIFSGDLWAGAEVMIFNLLRRLKDNPGLTILALSLNEGVLTCKLREIGVETHVISEAVKSFPTIFIQALRLFREKRITVIHSHRYKENLLALLLAKSIAVRRLIATLHGLSEPLGLWKDAKSSLGLKAKLNYFILKHAFTRVVAVSQEMKDVLIQQHAFEKSQVDLIYNGIRLPRFSHSSADRQTHHPFHIGTVGRLVPVKDFELFLEIAVGIKEQTSGVRFSILGDGPMKDHLICKVKELQLEDSVDFLPSQPDPLPYYQSLDLYLNTSHHEGLPLSVLEVMACGTPVVAPKVGGIPEIISHGENGWLVETRDPQAFVQACVNLKRDKTLRSCMGVHAAQAVACRFSDSRMAASYLKLYRDLAVPLCRAGPREK
jgi:glycosyltransferase involved in cell wall biosynthesis